MIKILKPLSIIFLLVLVSCHSQKQDAFYYHHNEDYLTSFNLPPLKLPPTYTGPPLDSEYVIPNSLEKKKKVDLLPPESELAQRNFNKTSNLTTGKP